MYFARSRELVGCNEEELNLSLGATTNFDEIMNALCTQHPSLSEIKETLMLAINLEYVQKDEQIVLKDSDELAVIPPISGG